MINGSILIGASERRSGEAFQAVDPATGALIEPSFSAAGESDVREACALAAAAAPSFADTDLDARAGFLEAVADRVAAIGDDLIVRAMRESGLPRARLEGERARTIGQLRLFAAVVRQGDWLDATIDPAMPDRTPVPRADIRRVNLPVGPVAVFGASNFPLAFSVAGGDTASAFAAGCPVVVKGHPAHPGTGELVAAAIRDAVKACGLHEGVFSYLPGPGVDLGSALVADPRIKAVGFTGSRTGGLALAKIASERPEPIPVYAEMSSINPVILLPHAAANRGDELATAFVQSLTMGAGQFCTNPGLVIAIQGEALRGFEDAVVLALSGAPASTMLTPGIHAAYERGIAALEGSASVETLARGRETDGPNQSRGALFAVDAADFVADETLSDEIFGSASVLVRCRDLGEMRGVIDRLEGQLTATLLVDPEDQADALSLIPSLSRKVGRLLANGWPTGVEVGYAMVHGGPYPATTDSRTTSVGSLAMMRFLRPVCFQDIPDPLLPAALQRDNPLGIARRVNGAWQPDRKQ
jgi:alpha-ketoglutaric semialdehyde dehydrogenase